MSYIQNQILNPHTIQADNVNKRDSVSASSESSDDSHSSSGSKGISKEKKNSNQPGFNVQMLLQKAGIDPKKNYNPISNIENHHLKPKSNETIFIPAPTSLDLTRGKLCLRYILILRRF
jgi:hypothetical protein